MIGQRHSNGLTDVSPFGSPPSGNLLAYGLLAIWMILIGVLTWNASQKSVIPPLWDQETYVQKADSFWAALKAGKPFNPLNLSPTVRPPATVLVSAPFGPESDYRRFYFRSVFLPIILFALALLIAGFATGMVGAEHALLTAVFCSIPLFWQFEMTDAFRVGYFWGLVDAFLGSLAALSAAVFLFAAVRRSSLWFAGGVCIAILLPLIKPTGFLISAMLVGCWAFLLATRILKDSSGIRGWLVHSLLSLGAAAACLGAVAFAAMESEYFSKANIAFGKEALRQLKSTWADVYAFDDFFGIITQAVGFPGLLVFLLLLGLYITSKMRGRHFRFSSGAGWDFALSAAVVVFGILICYQATGFKQVRYFFPFALIAAVLALPLLTALLRESAWWLKSVVCISPLGLLFFLLTPGYELAAHRFFGYSLFSGQFSSVPSKVQEIVARMDLTHQRAPVLYTTNDSAGVAAFEACFLHLFSSVSDGGATQPVLRPINWRSAAEVSLRAVAGADLVVFTAIPDAAPIDFPASFSGELSALASWLGGHPPNGSELVYSSGRTRCLRIKDGDAFEKAAEKFIASREWRPEFLRANERLHFLTSEVPLDPPSIIGPEKPMDFGEVARVHRLEYAITDGTLSVTAYVERLPGLTAGELSIFIHQIAPDGSIIGNNAMPISQLTSNKHPVERLNIEIQTETKAAKIGIGICKVGGVALVADERAQEWDHRRLVFPAGQKKH